MLKRQPNNVAIKHILLSKSTNLAYLYFNLAHNFFTVFGVILFENFAYYKNWPISLAKSWQH